MNQALQSRKKKQHTNHSYKVHFKSAQFTLNSNRLRFSPSAPTSKTSKRIEISANHSPNSRCKKKKKNWRGLERMQTGLELPVVVHRTLLQQGHLGLRPRLFRRLHRLRSPGRTSSPPDRIGRRRMTQSQARVGSIPNFQNYWARKGMADVAYN